MSEGDVWNVRGRCLGCQGQMFRMLGEMIGCRADV